MDQMQRLLNYREQLDQVKFFAERHTVLGEIFHAINVSIYTNSENEEDREFREASRKMMQFIEKKMMKKEEIHLADIDLQFFGSCFDCKKDNEDITLDFYDFIHDGPPRCPECECEFEIKPDGKLK